MNHCETCKWWGKNRLSKSELNEMYYLPDDMSDCGIADDDCNWMPEGMYISEDFKADYTKQNGASLITGRFFGCVLHEEKPS